MPQHKEKLPGELARIAHLVGMATAITLAERSGGRIITLPSDASVLAAREGITLAAARVLVEHYRRDAFYLPRARRAVARHLFFEARVPLADLPARCHCSLRSIYRYLATPTPKKSGE